MLLKAPKTVLARTSREGGVSSYHLLGANLTYQSSIKGKCSDLYRENNQIIRDAQVLHMGAVLINCSLNTLLLVTISYKV